MNRHEMRKLNLNSMIIFEQVMESRNMTRAAEALNLSQPMVSIAINRLRILFNDQLFIRVGTSIEPTSRATLLYEELSPAIDRLIEALTPACKKESHQESTVSADQAPVRLGNHVCAASPRTPGRS